MASINIDIDLDNFSTTEILSELEYRMKGEYDKQKIIHFLKSMNIDTNYGGNKCIHIDNLDDLMKFEFFKENIQKIKLNDLEKII